MVKRSDALKAVNTAVAGVVAAVATIFALFFVSPMPIHMNYRLFTLPIIGTVVTIWVVAYVFVHLSCRYNRNIYNELANSSCISEFRDAARWLGALLFVIIVGAILALVGRIFALLGYNRLKEWKPPQQT